MDNEVPQEEATSSENWRDSLPEDLRDNESLQKFTTIDGLAKSYVNAEQMIGKDKMVMPESESESTEVYSRLGRPEESSGYAYDLPQESGKELMDAFSEKAHSVGLNQKQYQEIQDWYWDAFKSGEQNKLADQETQFVDAELALKQAWGEKFNANLTLANRVADEFGGEEFTDMLSQKGLDNDITMTKFLYNLAQKTGGETSLEGDKGNGALSPDQMQMQINDLMARPAYLNNADPSHSTVVKQVQGLFSRLHTESSNG